jgi:membrane protease YdiL (CAAX protease family)
MQIYGTYYNIPKNAVWGNPIMLCVTLIMITVGPIVEEFIFRKFIFNLFMRKFSKITALLVSSMLFALAHIGDFGGTVSDIVAIMFCHFVMGIMLGLLYLRSEKLIYSIVAHCVYNLLILIPKPAVFYLTGAIDFPNVIFTLLPYFIVFIVSLFILATPIGFANTGS